MLKLALILWLGAFGLSWILVRVTRNVARKRGWVAPVRGDRWHVHATPLFGGVGVVTAFLVAVAMARGISDEFRDATSANPALVIAILVGAIGAAFTGLCDDIFHFRPGAKLAAQCGCACAFLWICGGVEITGSAPVDSVIALLWIVTVMNAVNMLDNMDGTAAAAVSVGFVGIAGMSWFFAPGSFVFGVALVAAGATVGFLTQNLPRAKIFMGDAGSLFLGFLLAALVLICARPVAIDANTNGLLESSQGWLVTIVAATGFVFVPLADMTVVSIARIRRGQSPMVGGRDHTTHRLSQMGFSGGAIVLIIVATATVSAGIAVAAATGVVVMTLAIGVLCGCFAVIVVGMLRVCVRMDDAAVGGTSRQLAAFTPFAKGVIDVITIAVAVNVGYLIRWDFTIPPELTNSVAWSLPVAMACCVSVNAFAGTYWKPWSGNRWRDVGEGFLNALLGAVIAVILIAALWSPERLFSRVALGLFLVIYPVLTAAMRMFFWRKA
jgi:UDP-GlcNAc:undecaprenyl-phosphate GlcNAc-1-phosphate transferase